MNWIFNAICVYLRCISRERHTDPAYGTKFINRDAPLVKLLKQNKKMELLKNTLWPLEIALCRFKNKNRNNSFPFSLSPSFSIVCKFFIFLPLLLSLTLTHMAISTETQQEHKVKGFLFRKRKQQSRVFHFEIWIFISLF